MKDDVQSVSVGDNEIWITDLDNKVYYGEIQDGDPYTWNWKYIPGRLTQVSVYDRGNLIFIWYNLITIIPSTG